MNRIVNISFCLLCVLIILNGCAKKAPETDEMILYASLPTKIRGLDPGDIGDVYSAKIAAQMYECLYQYHYLKRPYELIPALAESMPEISSDGLTYTIRIKKGVYFADDPCFEGGKGRELTAHDFIFAWKRIANIKYLSKNWWIFDDKIVGLDEFREYSKTCKTLSDVDLSRPVDGLQAPDDHTLVIKLKKNWPQITYLLSHNPTAPMAKEAVDYYGKDIISHPVGTGPFIMKKWHRGSYFEFERNPNFRTEFYPSEGEVEDLENGYLEDAGKRLPLIDRMFFTVIEENQPAWLLFLRGRLDASAIPKDNFNQVIAPGSVLTERMRRKGIHLRKFTNPDTFWIGFNMEDPIVGKNLPLRKAMAHAIDRKKYIDLFWNGRDQIAYGFIPPLLKAYNPKIKEVGQRYDLDLALRYAEEAKELNGGTLPVLTYSLGSTDTLGRQIAQFYQREFEKIGLTIELDYMDWPTFQEKVKTKSLQIFSLGWIADIPDTENFLQLFYSPNHSPGTNNFNYTSKEFDELYEKVVIMEDSPERTELYRKAEMIVIEDCPAIFINHRVAYVLHHDWIFNYKPHVFQYGSAKYRRLDMQKRKAYKDLLKKIK